MRPNIILAVLWIVLTSSVSGAPLRPGLGAVNGQVLGANRRPVAHARVTLQAADGKLPEIAETNLQGHFSFPDLRGGYYDVRAVSQGRVSEWRQNVLVAPGQEIIVVLHLRPLDSNPPSPSR